MVGRRQRLDVQSGVPTDKKGTAVADFIEKLQLKKKEKPQGGCFSHIQQWTIVCWHVCHLLTIEKCMSEKFL